MHEIKFNFCPKSQSSHGVRTWITKNYVEIKKLNPRLPFLIRDFEGIEPVVTAQYDFKSVQKPLTNLTEQEVEQTIIELVQLSDPETNPADHPYKAMWLKTLDQDNIDGIRGVEDRVIRLK